MPTNSNPLRVALVTGAGTGIGKAAAKALLSDGFSVVLTGRNLERLQKAINDIGGNESNCLAVACDVGKPEDVKALLMIGCRSLRKIYSQPDFLFLPRLRIGWMDF